MEEKQTAPALTLEPDLSVPAVPTLTLDPEPDVYKRQVDYIMPQAYWGYNYTLQNGSARFAFENIVDEWLAMPRDDSVSLAFGLGAYRIGAGVVGSGAKCQQPEKNQGIPEKIISG